ncbi:MAG: hypothetical protein HYU53_09970 [Acidobacteria bacterium]|nr:hypothetical protein [Acidobacteriota bacterium]
MLRPAPLSVGLLLSLAPLGAGMLAGPAEPPALDLRAEHRNGQTFLTWREAGTTQAERVPEGEDAPPPVRRAARRGIARSDAGTEYRIYRSSQPIASVAGMLPVGEVRQDSARNEDFYGITAKRQGEDLYYVIEDGKPPLAKGTGLFVYNPPAGQAYYAVTLVENGVENTSLERGNSLSEPVRETSGPGIPVLQRVEHPDRFNFVRGATLRYYVRWEVPPNTNTPGRPFDYVVAIPADVRWPAPIGIHMHSWGGNLNKGYGWWYSTERGAVLVASNQVPYDWWTGYHEALDLSPGAAKKPPRPKDAAVWQQGVVRPYTQRRLLSFVDWLATQIRIDPLRVFAAGSSMGGSGSLMLAIRFPERIAWAVSWVGVHIPEQSPRFKASYQKVYGREAWGVKFEDGTPVWDYYNDAWFLRRHPEKEIGFLTFSNGRTDKTIGWTQAVEFLQALQETRRPHMFVWGPGGHNQRARMPLTGEQNVMPLDLRVDQSLPAFSRGTLDDDPGDGSAESGDAEGQVNAFLYWDPATIRDEPDRWEAVVGVAERSAQSEGAADVTPRRLQRLRPAPGQEFRWTNTAVSSGRVVQSGTVTADQFGLITLRQVRVSKGRNRVAISREVAAGTPDR